MTQPSSIELVGLQTAGGQLAGFAQEVFILLLASSGVYLTRSRCKNDKISGIPTRRSLHMPMSTSSDPRVITSHSHPTLTTGMPHSFALSIFGPLIWLTGVSSRLRFRVRLL